MIILMKCNKNLLKNQKSLIKKDKGYSKVVRLFEILIIGKEMYK